MDPCSQAPNKGPHTQNRSLRSMRLDRRTHREHGVRPGVCFFFCWCLNLIVYSNQPFTTSEKDAFRELIQHIQPNTDFRNLLILLDPGWTETIIIKKRKFNVKSINWLLKFIRPLTAGPPRKKVWISKGSSVTLRLTRGIGRILYWQYVKLKVRIMEMHWLK